MEEVDRMLEVESCLLQHAADPEFRVRIRVGSFPSF